MAKIMAFDYPTQVTFWNEDLQKIVGGIGIEDYIICGCCGTFISLEEVYEAAEEDGIDVEDAVRRCGCWEDLDEFITKGKDKYLEDNLPQVNEQLP